MSNKIPVDQAPAGPAMDAAVAEVLGWKRGMRMSRRADFSDGKKYPWHFFTNPEGVEYKRPPSYSSDVAQALNLINSQEKQPFFRLERLHWYDGPEVIYWDAEVRGPSGWGNGTAATVALAICRAFLLAHGVTEIEVYG